MNLFSQYCGYRTQKAVFASLPIYILLLVIVAAVIVFGNDAHDRTMKLLLINITAILSIGIYSGNTGILTFGHISFMGLGAYISGIRKF